MKVKSIVSKISRFGRDESGNLTMILGIVAVPLIAASGLAVDMARITEARSAVQNAADGAALAAAIAQGSDEDREAVGMAYAAANLSSLPGVTATPEIEVDGNSVSVSIQTIVNGTLLAVAFPKSGSWIEGETHVDSDNLSLPAVAFNVSAGAEAEPGDSYYRCMIALNTTLSNNIYIRGTGEFTADECAVHSDSNHASTSIHLQGNADASASKFTAVGGWSQTGGAGSFSTTPVGDKPVAGDPYSLTVADPGGSATSLTIKKKDGNVSLSATKYENITVQAQGMATFSPGTHYITGTLSLGSQATVIGDGVTLVLLGSNSKIDMNSGGTLKLEAPTEGDHPGFAVIGDPSATTVQTNTVQGGAGGYIRGVWYTPKHKLYITGNGDFNTASNYFPVVADNVEIGGNGEFHLGFDWEEYDYPEPLELQFTQPGKAKLVN
ncbi:MAG: hypothetical protein KDK89_22760 [Alphaproteobacteria bacterium]|nr:hypothetical protein [Alphaproteobacteria bacterium]